MYKRQDYDRLVLEIETNGAINPRDAVVSAANIINQHMACLLYTSGQAPR